MYERLNSLTAQLNAGTITAAAWATAIHAERAPMFVPRDKAIDHDSDSDHSGGNTCYVCENAAGEDHEHCGRCGENVCEDCWLTVDDEPMCDSCRDDVGAVECQRCESQMLASENRGNDCVNICEHCAE